MVFKSEVFRFESGDATSAEIWIQVDHLMVSDPNDHMNATILID